MPPKLPLTEEQLRKLLNVSKSAAVIAALSSGIAMAGNASDNAVHYPDFPEFGQLGNKACSTIPGDANVEITMEPSNGKVKFIDPGNDGDEERLCYFSNDKFNTADAIGYMVTDGNNVVTDAGVLEISSDTVKQCADNNGQGDKNGKANTQNNGMHCGAWDDGDGY